MKELHFYALPLVHNRENRERYIADGGSHKDIYCTGPLNEVFGGTDWVVHGAFRDIGNTNYLSLSLSLTRAIISFLAFYHHQIPGYTASAAFLNAS